MFADLDLDKVAAVRSDGGVLNHRHWPEQGGTEMPPVAGFKAEVIDLR
ncbi:hypothetical protein [Methylobrevis pamukkalensis]|nr:hypothetical protein [Methylobrevis pamukkalensis]